jgi:pimeloyl-ACP methyl ester carboxylesterase
MDAAGSRRAVLMGVSEGGPLCSLFAATYPAKTEALVMIGSYARRMRDADYPWGTTADERDRFCQTIIDEWGGTGRAGRARAVGRRRSGFSRVVVGLPPHGRQSRRRRRPDAHERGDRRARRAAVDPRAGARHPSHGRSLPES